jgi:outer membrane cobalamin receptor
LQSNYTFQKAIDVTHSLSTSYKQQIPYMPYETFSTMFSIDYKKISLNYNFLFNGFRYILGENTYQNMIEAWKVTDISILSHFKIKKNDVKFKIEISNLFNKQYEVIKSFPMPGRAFYFTFTLSNE